jgi:hypothetical protein
MWKKPGDTGRHQIDYILVKQRYRNSVKTSCSYPGADADSDHNLVAIRVKLKLKKICRGKKQRRWDIERLKTNQAAFCREIENGAKCSVGTSVQEKWNELRDRIRRGAVKHVGFKKGRHAKVQVTEQ